MGTRYETESPKFLLLILMFIQSLTLNDSVSTTLSESRSTSSGSSINAACRDLPEVPNAELDLKDRNPPFALGTVIAFNCSRGYVSAAGIGKITCREDDNGNAAWDELPHACTGVGCSFPGEVKDAQRIGNVYTFPNNVTYVCNDGFILKGVGTIHCMPGGTWRPRLPHCEVNTAVTQEKRTTGATPKAVRCPYPGESENIVVQPVRESYEVGEIITHKCHDREWKTAKCLKNGKWTKLQQCQEDTTIMSISEQHPTESSTQKNPATTEVTAPTATDKKEQTITDQKREDVTASTKEHRKVTEVSQTDRKVTAETTSYKTVTQSGVESTTGNGSGLTCTPSILCINFCFFWSFYHSVTFLFSYFYDCSLHNAKKSKI